MLDKTFNPGQVEGRIYKAWEDSGAFRAGTRPGAEAYCIVIPPPNVTGSLHVGHALNNTLQDTLVRFERMRGKDVLWQPGTDHAGIATQLVVERRLAERQISRKSLGREKFIEEIWRWKEESGGTIVSQLRRLGASCDWSRERFTMDEGLSRAVIRVFVQLYREGLIYKDKRLVNWDPRLQTAVSDLEVEGIEMRGKLWYLKYPLADDPSRFVTVATTRPETMLGDTAVAVHPEDERYRDIVGKQVRLPLADRLIPIIADEHSDPEKGTGAVKITPGHDFNDFQVGKRHGLEVINILTPEAKLNLYAPEKYQGLDRFEARKRIVADLEEMGLLDKTEDITHAVPHDEKTKTVVLEPYLTEQWYLNVEGLAADAIKAVDNGKTRFASDQWRNVYFNWMRNIQPWCISRQLWWGHQIPAWYDGDGKMYVAETEVEAAKLAGGKAISRDPDVLDTWFSSALWPFSTLGWPEQTPELKRYYPTSVLITGFDIIFFWVARMMMMGIHFLHDVPFRDVFIHTRVLDEKGAKMSKTKGNVVDPVELIDAYGADALRFALSLAAGQARDMRIGASRVELARNFATKLWNAARFCEMNGCVTTAEYEPTEAVLPINQWIVQEVRTTEGFVRLHLSGDSERDAGTKLPNYDFSAAAGWIYRLVWDKFCDWFLEMAKPIFNGTDVAAASETRATAAWVLDQILKILHPFMPFITEELWARTSNPSSPRESLLIVTPWPTPTKWSAESNQRLMSAQFEMDWVIRLVSGVRSVRAEMNVPPAAKLPLVLKDADPDTQDRLARHSDVIQTLARLSGVEVAATIPKGSAQFVIGEAVAALPLGDVIDFAKERARLEKELKKTEDEIARFDSKLNNESFVARAPEDVIDEQREKRAEAAATAARLKEAVARLA